MKTIETERLLLRPWSMDDVEDFYAYAKNPEVGPCAGWKPHESQEESRGILQAWVNGVAGEENRAIVRKETGRVIGSISLMEDGCRPRVPNCRELGYVLAREEWGKGYMTEAARAILRYGFEELGLALLTVSHFSWNQRSRRVIEKCGFHYDGTLRQGAVLPDGTVTDRCCYSLTAQEYESLKTAWKRGL